MTAEINLLKVLSIKENLNNYVKLLNPKILSFETLQILKAIQAYFEVYKDSNSVEFDKFKEFFFINQYPTLDDSSIESYKTIISQIEKISLNDTSCTQIITAFEQQEFYNDLHTLLDNNVDIATVHAKVDSFKTRIDEISPSEPLLLDMGLEAALENEDRSKGLIWRLEPLREYFGGGVLTGDFILVCGYTNNGKTGFVISEIGYMAQQLLDDKLVLYFNTERKYTKILNRLYCSVLGCRLEDLKNYTNDAILKYEKKMHGLKDRVQIIDSKHWNYKKVEEYIKRRNPGLIVFDSLDHFTGFERWLNKDGTGDRNLQLYSWASEISVKYAPVIATSQTNRHGCNEMYIPLTEIRGSGVDKQSQADTVIFVGKLEGNNDARFISIPKNKFGKDDSWRTQVKFDAARTRFL